MSSDEALKKAVSEARKAYEANKEDAGLLEKYRTAEAALQKHRKNAFHLRGKNDERRLIDDAFCLVPFVSGAFREKGAKNFYVVSPFLRLLTPKIDIKTGEWHLYTADTLKKFTKAMNVCDLTWHDTLNDYTMFENNEQFIPLVKILEAVQEIEDKIIAALEKHKNTIALNATEIRNVLMTKVESFYNDAGTDAWKNHVLGELSDFIKKSLSVEDETNKYPFEVVKYAENHAFDCKYDLETVMKGSREATHRDTIHKKIHEQETNRVKNIVGSMKGYKTMYDALIVAIKGSPAGKSGTPAKIDPTITKQSLADALFSNSKETYSGEHTKLAAIDNIIQALLIERFELLSCHIHTFFIACIGRGVKVHNLAKEFIDDVIWYCLADFLRIGVKDLTINGGLVSPITVKEFVNTMNEAKAKVKTESRPKTADLEKSAKYGIVHSSMEWKSVFKSVIASVLETFTPVDLSENKQEVNSDFQKIRNTIYSGFANSQTPTELTKQCFPYEIFNQTSLDKIGGFVSSKHDSEQKKFFIESLGESKKPPRRIVLGKFCFDPIRDAGLDFINKKLTSSENPTYRYSFELAKKILYANYHDVPSFVCKHLFDDVESANRTQYAKQYLHDIHIPIVTGTSPAGDYKGPKPSTITWESTSKFPFTEPDMTLKLNTSALTQTTKPQNPARNKASRQTTPKKESQPPKKESQPVKSVTSTTQRSTLKIGPNQGRLVLHKEKKGLQTSITQARKDKKKKK